MGILTQESTLVKTGKGTYIVSEPSDTLERIRDNANQWTQADFPSGPVKKKDDKVIKGPGGVLWLRETRGYLIFQVWRNGLPGGMQMTLLMWDSLNRRWEIWEGATEEKVRAWLAEAEELMGIEDKDEPIPPAEAPEEKPVTLLTLALDEVRTREQWHSGQIVTIWQVGDTRAWIKNQNGWLVLVLFRDAKELAACKYSKPLAVGLFDPQARLWEPSATVKDDYADWVRQARIDIGTTATVHKLDALAIARKAGATHRDARKGHTDTFYRVIFATGRVEEMSVNGTARQWQASRFDHAPDWCEAI